MTLLISNLNHFVLSDVDECTLSLLNCHENATCNNTEGSFDCYCKEGFTGNGTYCKGKGSFSLKFLSVSA